jgi:hypothetical protein
VIIPAQIMPETVQSEDIAAGMPVKGYINSPSPR